MLVLIATAALGLGAWTAWLIRRARLPPWLYAPAGVATVGVLALALLALARLTRTLHDTHDMNPADRQAALSDGIASAMRPTAVALIVVGAWLLAMVVATRWLRRRVTPRSRTAP